jgi:HSP20 family protein
MEREVRKIDSQCGCITVPPVDIYEEDQKYTLKADMPGVTKESLDITLDDRELTITGHVNRDGAEDPGYAEYAFNDYKRTFIVTEKIDAEGITAALENGVLTVSLPKSEKAKPRNISITVH